MAKIRFREIKLSFANKQRLQKINEIIEEYQEQNFVLTLRQLYYQLVSRDIIPNKQTEYSKLSTLLKEGRMGGIVDWDAIEDRLRQPYKPSAFDSPQDIVRAAIQQYEKPRMKGQEKYLEVWVEKDALSGVLKRVTSKYHVPILVNRGYSSASAMFDSYERFAKHLIEGKKTFILYLGDFDPSGMDMIRDIKDRLLEFFFNDWTIRQKADSETFSEARNEGTEEYDRLSELYDNDRFPVLKYNGNEDDVFDSCRAWIYDRFGVVPIALTRAQIRQYNPPPNPAKRTDPRANKFIKEHGSTSWEVDALKPEVLNALLTDEIEKRIDLSMYNTILEEEIQDVQKLEKLITKL